jgi:hypothetical protein
MGAFGYIMKGLYNQAQRKVILKLECDKRTKEQIGVIKYMNTGGCGSVFGVDDNDFDQILASNVQKLNIYNMAIQRLCVDESDVKEINPVLLDGYFFDRFRFLGDAAIAKNSLIADKNSDSVGTYVKIGRDDLIRFSKYKLSCILFGKEQVYFYSYRFDLTNLNVREETAEFFYKDIDSIEVTRKINDRWIEGKGCLGFLKGEYGTFTYPEVRFTVPGNSFSCSMRTENESAIIGLKNLIRTKRMDG